MNVEWFREFMGAGDPCALGLTGSAYQELLECVVKDFEQEIQFKSQPVQPEPVIITFDNFSSYFSEFEDTQLFKGGSSELDQGPILSAMIERPSLEVLAVTDIDDIAVIDVQTDLIETVESSAKILNVVHQCETNPDFNLINHGDVAAGGPSQKVYLEEYCDSDHEEYSDDEAGLVGEHFPPLKTYGDECDNKRNAVLPGLGGGMVCQTLQRPGLSIDRAWFENPSEGYVHGTTLVPYTHGKLIVPCPKTVGTSSIAGIVNPAYRDMSLEVPCSTVCRVFMELSSRMFLLCEKPTRGGKVNNRFKLSTYVTALVSRAYSNDYCNLRMDSGSRCDLQRLAMKSRYLFTGYPFAGIPPGQCRNFPGAATDVVVFWSSCGDIFFSAVYDLVEFCAKLKLFHQFGTLVGDLSDHYPDLFQCSGKGRVLGLYSTEVAVRSEQCFVKLVKMTDFEFFRRFSRHIVCAKPSSNPAIYIVYVDRAFVGGGGIDFSYGYFGVLFLANIGQRYDRALHIVSCLKRLAWLTRSVLYFEDKGTELNGRD